MRDYLYRGFYKDKNGFCTITLNGKKIKGSWAYGNLHIVNYANTKPQYEIWKLGGGVDICYTIIPETLGEYVMTDKNDRVIFTNDYVKTKYGRICEVVWRETSQFIGFDLIPIEDKNKMPDEWDLYSKCNIELVGNSYEHKGLIQC